jgi:hypothetical protein
MRTVVFAWTATELKLSMNGGSFTATGTSTISNSSIPTLAAANFAIGGPTGGGSGNQLNGAAFWFMAGSGTLTDSDLTTIAGWGNTDPLPHLLPASAQPKFSWAASTARALKSS